MKIYFYTLAIVGAMLFIVPQAVNASTSVEIIDQDNQPGIYINGSVLRITNANGLQMAIYNVTGVQVMTAKVEGFDKHYDLNLPKGCYIVKVGKTVRKIYIM